jgi:hypothetical protein
VFGSCIESETDKAEVLVVAVLPWDTERVFIRSDTFFVLFVVEVLAV